MQEIRTVKKVVMNNYYQILLTIYQYQLTKTQILTIVVIPSNDNSPKTITNIIRYFQRIISVLSSRGPFKRRDKPVVNDGKTLLHK